MPSSVAAVKPEVILTQLPSVPDWFRRELAQVATREGKPMFKLVDGQRELHWRRGKWDVKHLTPPVYIPVITQVFRRKIKGADDYRLYSSHAQAKADTLETLEPGIDVANFVSTRGVGRACWIVEVYLTPDEIGGPARWEAARYQELQVHGVFRKVDVLGEFPREGMYVYCFPVVDEDGNAISPNRRIIDECKKRWKIAQGETASVEQNIQEWEDRAQKFERKQAARIADNIYQYHGITAKRLHYGEISKPITKVYE